MDVSQLLNQLGSVVADAKAKADVVAKLKADLAKYTADKQTAIDAAQASYDDAQIAASRLQDGLRSVIGELLPVSDPRYRVSK
jgi:hypothetical protein